MTRDRNIGVAVDFSKGSKIALKWAINNLAHEKGDTLYAIHVKPSQGDESRNLLWSTTGSRTLPIYHLINLLSFIIFSGWCVWIFWAWNLSVCSSDSIGGVPSKSGDWALWSQGRSGGLGLARHCTEAEPCMLSDCQSINDFDWW